MQFLEKEESPKGLKINAISTLVMKRSSRRWKKKRQMRWKWQRKRMKKEKRKRKVQAS